MPDRALAARVLSEITDHPERYDQAVWMGNTDHVVPGRPLACGTTLCVAGHAAHFTGYTLHRVGIRVGRVEATKGGTTLSIKKAAQQALGITDWDALRLFDTHLPVTHARAALAQLVAGADTIDWHPIRSL